jgi:PPOX class probable F420-dependent enzyme
VQAFLNPSALHFGHFDKEGTATLRLATPKVALALLRAHELATASNANTFLCGLMSLNLRHLSPNFPTQVIAHNTPCLPTCARSAADYTYISPHSSSAALCIIRGMAIPENYLDLFTTKKSFANIATVMPNGTPQVTPVWIDFDGTNVVYNTAKGRVKDRNLKLGTWVAIAVSDPDDPYRYIQVRGPVVEIIENDDAQIDKLAKKYRGLDVYPYKRPAEIRVTYKIAPQKTNVMG